MKTSVHQEVGKSLPCPGHYPEDYGHQGHVFVKKGPKKEDQEKIRNKHEREKMRPSIATHS